MTRSISLRNKKNVKYDSNCNMVGYVNLIFIKDTYREKAPSNETPVLTKSTSMIILVVGISKQLFIIGS